MNLITDLISAGIIDEPGAAELTTQFERADAKTDTTPLKILFRFFESKLVKQHTKGGWHAVLSPSPDIDPAKPGTGKTVIDTFIDILYYHGCISQHTHNKVSSMPHKNAGYLGVVYLVSELNEFYFNFSVEKQLEFAELFGKDDFPFKNRMLSEGSKKKLLRDIKQGKTETYLDFFKYSFCCFRIDLTTYKADLPGLLQKLKDGLNKLIFNAFRIVNIGLEEADFNGEPSYNNKQATLLLNTGSRIHEHSFTFSKSKGNLLSTHRAYLENVLITVNSMLASYSCSYRFTGVTSTLNEAIFPYSRKQYAICRVDQENKQLFEFYGVNSRFLFNSPMLNYNMPLSYTHIAHAVYHFKNCGLFVHLNEKQIADTVAMLYNKTYNYSGDLLAAFHGTVATISRSIRPGEKPYLNFLQLLNSVSHGVLNFIAIEDHTPSSFDYDSADVFKVLFNIGQKQHEIECSVLGNEFDERLIYYVINEIIRKDYPDYELMQIISGDYLSSYYLFATRRQSNYLRKMNLRETVDRF